MNDLSFEFIYACLCIFLPRAQYGSGEMCVVGTVGEMLRFQNRWRYAWNSDVLSCLQIRSANSRYIVVPPVRWCKPPFQYLFREIRLWRQKTTLRDNSFSNRYTYSCDRILHQKTAAGIVVDAFAYDMRLTEIHRGSRHGQNLSRGDRLVIARSKKVGLDGYFVIGYGQTAFAIEVVKKE